MGNREQLLFIGIPKALACCLIRAVGKSHWYGTAFVLVWLLYVHDFQWQQQGWTPVCSAIPYGLAVMSRSVPKKHILGA